MSGMVTEECYGNYLFNLLPCYSIIERKADYFGLLDGIEGIVRANRILQDMDDLKFTPTFLGETTNYMEHLDSLCTPNHILSHLYVRHFGDLFGGQMIKKLVPSKGRMYEFENRSELIEKARAKLHEGLSDEANLAFDYAVEIFEGLANVFHLPNS
jgi:hypothetical protein